MTTIIYDLETTGLSPTNDRIIEAYFLNTGNQTFKHIIVNPGVVIPPEVSKVNGWTNMDVDKYPKLKDVVYEIMDFCEKGCYLVAHNNDPFDKQFMRNAFKKLGFNSFASTWKFVDTLKIARQLYPTMPNHKQETLQKKFNIRVNNNHKANNDVLDLSRIFEHLCEELGNPTIEKLHQISSKFRYNTMPFGKFSGKKFQDIPLDYLQYMYNNNMINKSDVALTKTILIQINKKLLKT